MPQAPHGGEHPALHAIYLEGIVQTAPCDKHEKKKKENGKSDGKTAEEAFEPGMSPAHRATQHAPILHAALPSDMRLLYGVGRRFSTASTSFASTVPPSG